jgi:undecaprenyl-diphosphatase
LGNGALYLPLAIIVIFILGWNAWPVVWPAVVSTAIAHAVYPFIKSSVARPRPFDRDPTLTPLVAPLDAYSCPSGHCMTAAAILTPLAVSYPQTALPLGALILAIGWARVATAHHYPSDLLFGTVLGAAIALLVRGQFGLDLWRPSDFW